MADTATYEISFDGGYFHGHVFVDVNDRDLPSGWTMQLQFSAPVTTFFVNGANLDVNIANRLFNIVNKPDLSIIIAPGQIVFNIQGSYEGSIKPTVSVLTFKRDNQTETIIATKKA